jgi:exo-1,4-beta-D-glucosaminidase
VINEAIRRRQCERVRELARRFIKLVEGQPTVVSSLRQHTDEQKLRDNWFIQPSADGPADGAAISAVGFPTRGWYPATLPSTVLSALVEDKVYPDPYTGMNLRSIPGTTYPIFEDFSNIPMPPNSPFRQPWWFRTEFKLPTEYSGKSL